MQEKFIRYFSQISPLSQEEARGIADSMQTKAYPKGAYLLREGQISTDTFFVLEGCIREYILTDGEEKTTNFYTEDQWAMSINSFASSQPATHNWVAAEDSLVVVGNEQQAQDLFQRFPRFETISRAIMESVFAEQKQALESYYSDTPEQRYLKVIASRPDLVQRVPQYQLASYIGVKPESLSRIRKRIADKKRE